MRDESPLFGKLFKQAIEGTQGGLEWLIWSLDEMVRDLMSHEPGSFCPLTPFYVNLQLKLSQVAAFLAAEDGLLYQIDDKGTVILGRNFTTILGEQMSFVKEKCHEYPEQDEVEVA